jgi:hypothetical protein
MPTPGGRRGLGPASLNVLYDRLGRRTHPASMHLAMLHLRRIEDRVIALLADRALNAYDVSPPKAS